MILPPLEAEPCSFGSVIKSQPSRPRLTLPAFLQVNEDKPCGSEKRKYNLLTLDACTFEQLKGGILEPCAVA